MDDESVPKRRRVTRACENCRALKSKCDGKQPVCNRCRGYGYSCQWKDRNTRPGPPGKHKVESNEGSSSVEALLHLKEALHATQAMLRRLREKVEPEDQCQIDLALSSDPSSPTKSSIRSPLSLQAFPSLLKHRPHRPTSGTIHRYLGEVSDVSFFNSVKALFQTDMVGNFDTAALESYERETASSLDSLDDRTLEHRSLDRNTADCFVGIYFSTIHVAYPFICKQQFEKDYKQFWNQNEAPSEPSTFNALVWTIFAIGSYYNFCALTNDQPSPATHTAYFRHAVLTACQSDAEQSIESIRLLLAQCFYLLATCQTDRCWTTLGLAIRTGQALGLHVEAGHPRSQSPSTQVERESRRRTWHSLYVLDRLLSLQLGRPSAIRNRDCDLRLPSRLDDASFDLGSNTIPEVSENEPQAGDYFIAVIRFSHILGDVMRDLHRPGMTDYTQEMLDRIDRLDAELLKWKAQLPRWLRFDRGHTFENSAMLKRQRNMLAIKFHHLRALIHRPNLCLPWLQRNDSKIKDLLSTHARRVVHSERICMQEAQATAHLLHDVTDKKSLVEDYPWWQMISCLICASSILLVMRAFTSYSTADQHHEMLEEDADTCLKVFDALSTNSDAARRARDMLQNLRETKNVPDTNPDSVCVPDVIPAAGEGTLSENPTRFSSGSLAASDADVEWVSESQADLAQGDSTPLWIGYDWPSEIADSMAWSFQFVDTVDPAAVQVQRP